MTLNKLLLIDGNSIINRAFYGIMGSKMLMTEDGTYTNAVYGFLSILFKELDDIKPEYLVVAFDLKAPTHRHKMYDKYKANRHGMPEELAMQMPILKETLKAMNVCIIEKEGYEADDILGTLAKWGQKEELEVTVLTGDRDSFQLIDKNIKVRIPRTKMGKTETEDYTVEKIEEEYGLEPLDLIEVKGLMGDTSDNIPGVPGVGEKTALNLIKQYKSIDEVYNHIDEQKGKLKEKLSENKDLAYLSRTLGTIDINAPIEKDLGAFQVEEWNKPEVLEIFKKLKFNRFIDRFALQENIGATSFSDSQINTEIEHEKIVDKTKLAELKQEIQENKVIYYYLTEEKFIIYSPKTNKCFSIENIQDFKDIFEDKNILKCSYKQKEEFIILWNKGIEAKNLMFDIAIAGYILNSNINKYTIEYLANEYINFDIAEYLSNTEETGVEQITLFDNAEEPKEDKTYIYAYAIYKLYNVLTQKMEEAGSIDLFNKIEMPLTEVLASMQYEGIYIDKQELLDFGKELQEKIDILTQEIYELTGEEFNINSTKQLGEILFEKLKLTAKKKTKTGYSTDVDVLEKIKYEHPVIEKILEYRQLQKLNSTYVEGLIPYIDETGRIHSKFHQTVTTTGRISSTDPNLQNIPTRMELGRKLRKVFKPEQGYIFVDADYSQIELRVLAHISKDKNMIEAFCNNEDIHAQAASKVFNIPLEEVTKEERTKAKAVNFGIVYGISEFGLGEQLGVSRKKAKEYIEQYLDKYSGIKEFMINIVEETKEKGYVETLYHRRRYVPELKSNNYMVRQFGGRVAMNTPIQGTAADIMKIAMINVYNKLKENNLKSKLIVQVHDEILVETLESEKEQVKQIVKEEMENVIKLKVPLLAEVEEGYNWYEAK
ncbi:MAG TPA: DNA polymerase I [Clostridiaceae bacterium]|nr:DNA polymerase I [Clostridiaceae bacterium]